MKNINKKIFFIALILSIVTSYLTYSYLKNIEKQNKSKEYIELIVASRDILPREKITADMLKKIKVLKESHIVNSIQNTNEIVGMYAKERILKGEVIPKERLFKEEEKYLSLRIPQGKRAISIAVDEVSGVADLIKPGDFVDIYVTVKEKQVDSRNVTNIYPDITKLLLQNIQVLSVGKEQFPGEEERKDIPNRYSITLAVTALEGEKLVLGEEIGNLKLALRPVKDEEIHETPGAIRKDLVPDRGVITTY